MNLFISVSDKMFSLTPRILRFFSRTPLNTFTQIFRPYCHYQFQSPNVPYGYPYMHYKPFMTSNRYCGTSTSHDNLTEISEYIYDYLQKNQPLKQDKSTIKDLCKFLLSQDVDDDIIKAILCNSDNPSKIRLSQLEALAEVFAHNNINTSKIFGDLKFFLSAYHMNTQYLQSKLLEFDQMKIGQVPFTEYVER